MELKDLIKQLPWYWMLWLALVTGIMLIPVTIYILLALCNPFWFRESMLISCNLLIDTATKIRIRLMKPALDKYLLFETLKKGEKPFWDQQ